MCKGSCGISRGRSAVAVAHAGELCKMINSKPQEQVIVTSRCEQRLLLDGLFSCQGLDNGLVVGAKFHRARASKWRAFFESFQEAGIDVGAKSGVLNEQFICLAGSEPRGNPQII